MKRHTNNPHGRPISTGRGHAGPAITIRLSVEELAEVRLAAGNVKAATWARLVLLAAARRR